MNIFLNLFRRSKIDQALADRVTSLESRAAMQGAENRASYERINSLSSKCSALQNAVAISNAKVNKLQESNRLLQSKVLKIHLAEKDHKSAAEIAQTMKDAVIEAFRESAKLLVETRETQVVNTLNIGGVDVQMRPASEPYAYERTIAAPECEWRPNTTLDQTYHTVADYYAKQLPSWAVGKVTQQSLTYRVSKLAQEGFPPVAPVAVKTAARTMARSWPAWLLEKAAGWITLEKGGILPNSGRVGLGNL